MDQESRPTAEAPPAGETPPQETSAVCATPAAGARAAPPRRRRRSSVLARAFRAGAPLEGTIERVIKGGYEVRVGSARGFCPHSQMDLQRVEDPEAYVGRTVSFRVLELRRGGEEAILSRRALLEEERAEEAKAVRATLLEGAVMRGRVVRLADFGAFVDLGAGVTGLVHVSEVSYNRVLRPADELRVGDCVWVKILKLDETGGRISLSIRQAQEDPWKEVGSRFEKGRTYSGTVRRLTDFGAFVELSPGIEALAPAREFPPGRGNWADGLEPGARGEWVVLSVEQDRRRLTVAPWWGEGFLEAGAAPAPGAKLRAKVQRADPQGLRVWLGPGHPGFVPLAWTGVARATEMARRFPAGAEVSVEVVEVSPETGVRCAIEGVERRSAAPKSPRKEEPRQRDGRRASAGEKRGDAEPAPRSGSFGTNLGEALRAAMEKRGGM